VVAVAEGDVGENADTLRQSLRARDVGENADAKLECRGVCVCGSSEIREDHFHHFKRTSAKILDTKDCEKNLLIKTKRFFFTLPSGAF
jgi:hypothetical protein